MKSLFLLLLTWISLPLAAQSLTMDGEMEYLVSIVRLLGQQKESSFQEACRQLSADMKWTPMNETGVFQEGECSPTDKVPGFKLNRALSRVAGDRKYVSVKGDMLNGEDERYDYSLYERSVRAGQTVRYTLKGREGNQLFVLVPYSGMGLSGSVTAAEGEPVPFIAGPDGTMVAHLHCPSLKKDQPVTITVVGGRQSQAFVLLNHNTRSR